MNSRQKGKRVERLWRDQLREAGFLKSFRGQQYCGAAGNADVVCPELPSIHFEVKGVQNLNVLAAMKQAIADSGAKTPVVAHKKNGEPWLVTMLADDWLRLCPELPSIHFEVKGVQNLNVLAAMKQAIADSGAKTPVVAHKKNGEPWLVTMLADDWLRLVRDSDWVTPADHQTSPATGQSVNYDMVPPRTPTTIDCPTNSNSSSLVVAPT